LVFKHPLTTELYTLSLHDALPILEALPLRNVPVIAPTMALDGETIDSAQVSEAIKGVLRRLDLGEGDSPVAVFVPWQGSATFQRSGEHTSELQSLTNLLCRLLLGK